MYFRFLSRGSTRYGASTNRTHLPQVPYGSAYHVDAMTSFGTVRLSVL